MSNKTITKIFSFVIFTFVICGFFSGCHLVSSSRPADSGRAVKDISTDYKKAEIVGTIKSGELTESSGIAASKCRKDVFWTHNDSGDGAFLYAINSAGEKLGTWKVSGAKNVDWEDVAAFKDANGECFLYLGDIGNNERTRGDLAVYKVKEPRVSDADANSSRKKPLSTENSEAIKFDYPDMRHDAETLLVHPQSGDIYILTKRLSDAAGVYKLAKDYDTNKINRLEKIADFTVPAIPNGFLTGGDISPDGKRVIICDYFSAYEIVLPATAQNFDDIWREQPLIVELGEREQGEAVGYAADGAAIYATSEKKNSPIIEVRRK
ncbi:MAG: hypothetical protein LH614_06590 [Pyrinomonadaceae bacterium]|nr:hypothetical protein [Pyrinomonadaceae bacterium]